MSFWKKVWAWIKRWWKLLLGFVLALGGIVIVKEIFDGDDTNPSVPIPDFGKEGEDLADEIVAAAEERDRKLIELSEKNQDRLENLSDEQEKELQDLAEKPVDEVVAWFDNL